MQRPRGTRGSCRGRKPQETSARPWLQQRVSIALALLVLLVGRVAAARSPDIELFTREGCPRCDEAKVHVRELSERHPELVIEGIDVGRDPAARQRLSELVAERGAVSVPTMRVRGGLVVGWSEASTPALIEALLAGRPPPLEQVGGTCLVEESVGCEPPEAAPAPPASKGITLPVLGHVDVAVAGPPLFTVAVGPVDGFNPCAMRVSPLPPAFPVNVRSRLRMALVAGIFVVVSGLAYFAFMAAWLKLLIGAVILVLGLLLLLRPQWLSWG